MSSYNYLKQLIDKGEIKGYIEAHICEEHGHIHKGKPVLRMVRTETKTPYYQCLHSNSFKDQVRELTQYRTQTLANDLTEEMQQSIREGKILLSSNYQCPICEAFNDSSPPRSKLIKPIFTGDLAAYGYEPGYTWLELHECENCSTKYIINNGC